MYQSCPKDTYLYNNKTCHKEILIETDSNNFNYETHEILNKETNSENIKNEMNTEKVINHSDYTINSELNRPIISINKTNSELIFNNDDLSNTIYSNNLNPSTNNYYHENTEIAINTLNTNKNEFNIETTNNSEKASDLNELQDLNKNIYSYDIIFNLSELFDIYKNLTFIDFSQELVECIYKIYNLNKDKDKILIVIEESTSLDLRIATTDYNYRMFLKNGTELNLSLIKESNYVDIYVPIEKKDIVNYNYSKYFSLQGYDIYNKSSDFYNDFCTSAYYQENDITIKDRKKYIYPNISLCKNKTP